jgi:hypothetical protein
MSNSIFTTTFRQEIEEKIKNIINTSEDLLSRMTAQSPRAAGDAIELLISNSFEEIIGEFANEWSTSFSRRSMADLAFTDKYGNYYIIDVKTHRIDTKFSMPNLTSVERLSRFYEDEHNYFSLMLIDYSIHGSKIICSNVTFVPIEFLSWDCLTIGALGWGQIQIINSNNVILNLTNSRKQWMLDFCDIMLDFYPNEISKIEKRITRFNQVRSTWHTDPASLIQAS